MICIVCESYFTSFTKATYIYIVQFWSIIIILLKLGTPSTSPTYRCVQHGYLLGYNVDILLWAPTIRNINNVLISKNSFRFGYRRCSHFPSILFTKNPVEVNCCKICSLCVVKHIISMSKNIFYSVSSE